MPLIGAVMFGAAFYGSVHPTPTGILAWTPWLSLVWLAAGVAILLWLRARRPEAVAQIGSILGEEGRCRRRRPRRLKKNPRLRTSFPKCAKISKDRAGLRPGRARWIFFLSVCTGISIAPGLAVGLRGVADIPGLVAVVSVKQQRAFAPSGSRSLNALLRTVSGRPGLRRGSAQKPRARDAANSGGKIGTDHSERKRLPPQAS